MRATGHRVGLSSSGRTGGLPAQVPQQLSAGRCRGSPPAVAAGRRSLCGYLAAAAATEKPCFCSRNHAVAAGRLSLPVRVRSRSWAAPQAPGWAALCSTRAVPTCGLRVEGSRNTAIARPLRSAVLRARVGR